MHCFGYLTEVTIKYQLHLTVNGIPSKYEVWCYAFYIHCSCLSAHRSRGAHLAETETTQTQAAIS